MAKLMTSESFDIVIVGAGAAGLFAAVFAARTGRRVCVLDGAEKPGAKILVSGGGRCNVTHDEVSAEAYAGSSRNAIKKVLRRFDVPQTVAFFAEQGVMLKREDTGKLFPTTDSARSVLEALLGAARSAGVVLRVATRVERIERQEDAFTVSGGWGQVSAPRVILATGGRSLPKSGSDGQGYKLAQALGHTLTPRIFPALVPLTLPHDHFLCALSGLTTPAVLEVRDRAGRRLVMFSGSTLCTHFGLSGPSVLDISRYYRDALLNDPEGTQLVANWLLDETPESFDRVLLEAGRRSAWRVLGERLPERLARALCAGAGVDASAPLTQVTREARRGLARAATALVLPITGDRGYTYAEVTAGGIPLSEIRLETMESRVCPGLHLCGEICDVDGRIGGYNFQWAWSSGYVAGVGAASDNTLT
jgi:predicted Rossmann fold flavoprotein